MLFNFLLWKKVCIFENTLVTLFNTVKEISILPKWIIINYGSLFPPLNIKIK